MTIVTVVAKAFWKSKTIITNVALALPPVLDALTGANLPFTHAQWYLGLVLGVNVVLRFASKGPVALAAKNEIVQVKQPPSPSAGNL